MMQLFSLAKRNLVNCNRATDRLADSGRAKSEIESKSEERTDATKPSTHLGKRLTPEIMVNEI